MAAVEVIVGMIATWLIFVTLVAVVQRYQSIDFQCEIESPDRTVLAHAAHTVDRDRWILHRVSTFLRPDSPA